MVCGASSCQKTCSRRTTRMSKKPKKRMRRVSRLVGSAVGDGGASVGFEGFTVATFCASISGENENRGFSFLTGNRKGFCLKLNFGACDICEGIYKGCWYLNNVPRSLQTSHVGTCCNSRRFSNSQRISLAPNGSRCAQQQTQMDARV